MKIALIGYGKMGKMIEEIARSRGHEIVSIIDIDNQEDFESEAFKSADVAIEFTAPSAAWGNVQRCWAKGVKVVSGSTGWMKDHAEEVQQACAAETAPGVPNAQQRTLLWASNFSIGVNIFAAVNRYLARIMNQFPQYDVQMEETHHVHKLDHPSGTAITLAEDLLAEVDRKEDWEVGRLVEDGQLKGFVIGSGGDASKRCTEGDGTLGGVPSYSPMLKIDCVRRGEVPGIHTVKYDSDADEIVITHSAHNRRGFAMGAVLAAEWVKDQQGLLTINQFYQQAYGF